MTKKPNPGNLARMSSESWDEMTEAARQSPNHVNSLERWIKKARQLNPLLDDDQTVRLAEKLKQDHFQRMAKLSVEARARKAAGS